MKASVSPGAILRQTQPTRRNTTMKKAFLRLETSAVAGLRTTRSPYGSRAAILFAASLMAAMPAAAADLIDGTVLAYDRVANIIVLSDKSVFPLSSMKTPLSEDLVAGDRIEISYESNEDDGIFLVHSVTRLP